MEVLGLVSKGSYTVRKGSARDRASVITDMTALIDSGLLAKCSPSAHALILRNPRPMN